jgi:hypothetical protein
MPVEPPERFALKAPKMRLATTGGGTESLQTPRWRETDSNLYGAFPVKWCFGLLLVLCSELESRSSFFNRAAGGKRIFFA